MQFVTQRRWETSYGEIATIAPLVRKAIQVPSRTELASVELPRVLSVG